MPIRQADAPNQCSSANKAVDILLWYWNTCIALQVLRYAAQFVTLLAAHTAFITAATCVLHATSFSPSFVPLFFSLVCVIKRFIQLFIAAYEYLQLFRFIPISNIKDLRHKNPHASE